MKQAIPLPAILTPYAEQMGLQKKLYNFGNHETISRIARCSGAIDYPLVQEAHTAGYNLLITGE